MIVSNYRAVKAWNEIIEYCIKNETCKTCVLYNACTANEEVAPPEEWKKIIVEDNENGETDK